MKKAAFFTLAIFYSSLILSACPHYYSEMTLQDHTKLFPIAEHEWWTKVQNIENGKIKLSYSPYYALPDGVAVSVKATYTGEFRPITPDAYEAIDKFGGENMKGLYTYEMRITEKGFDGWVLLPLHVMGKMKEKLKKDDTFYACMILIGVLNDNHLYLLNDFNANQ